MGHNHESLPAGPLLAALDAHNLSTASGSLRRAMERIKKADRVTVRQADSICVKVLGVHPSAVYGPVWYE